MNSDSKFNTNNRKPNSHKILIKIQRDIKHHLVTHSNTILIWKMAKGPPHHCFYNLYYMQLIKKCKDILIRSWSAAATYNLTFYLAGWTVLMNGWCDHPILFYFFNFYHQPPYKKKRPFAWSSFTFSWKRHMHGQSYRKNVEDEIKK